MPPYSQQKKNRIAGLGTRALGLLAAVIDQAQAQFEKGEPITKVQLDALRFVINANPGMLRSKAFKLQKEEAEEEEPKEKSVADLTTEELLQKAKEQQA